LDVLATHHGIWRLRGAYAVDPSLSGRSKEALAGFPMKSMRDSTVREGDRRSGRPVRPQSAYSFAGCAYPGSLLFDRSRGCLRTHHMAKGWTVQTLKERIPVPCADNSGGTASRLRAVTGNKKSPYPPHRTPRGFSLSTMSGVEREGATPSNAGHRWQLEGL
jgi:hypothetical protein